jgi:hypothetical protein
MTALAKKHGPIMQLQLGEELAIIISSPTVAKQVLKTHDTSFTNRPGIFAVEVVTYNYSGTLNYHLFQKFNPIKNKQILII